MAKKKKDAAPKPEAKGELEEIPLSTAALPLLQLDPRALSEFLELAFSDRRLLELCSELRLYAPGYRLESMPPNQVARMLADEARGAKDAAALLERAVREALRNPVFEGKSLDDEQWRDTFELFTGDPLQHLARCAWRALLEEDDKRKSYALSAIDLGIESLDALAQAKPQPRKAQLPSDVQELRKAVDEAHKTAERANLEKDSAREQLAAARGELAAREKALGDARDEIAAARAELSRASAELLRLTAAGEGRALSDARRLGDENRSLTEKLRVALEERNQLREKLREAESEGPAEQPVAVSGGAGIGGDLLPSAEEASTFLIPIFTREFYDSIQRWDRRMQRAAFDKVSLLARDWRHGSLRALALEGLPGYYRIRIATDVRLIYRRGEGNQLEILSLIDREDLDRYIRLARTS
jgi:hypothetical protein